MSALELYRVYGPLGYAGVKVINGVQQGELNLDIIRDCEIVLFQRDFARHFKEYQAVVDRARELKIPIVLDLDDDLLALPSDHPDRISSYFADGLLPILHAIVNVDGITVTTLPLRETIHKLNPNIWVLPNYLDEQVWELRSPLSDSGEQPLTILYMGTPTHRPDLDVISEPLFQLAKLFGDKIQFLFLGVEPPTGLKGISQVTYQPVLTYDYNEFVVLMNDVHADIAIAPLCDNEFNRSKSAIKFFEYSAMGIPAVYSDMPPYSKVIRDGYEGLLATAPDQWFEKIQLLIQQPDLRREIVQNAQTSIRQNWLLSDHATDWERAYSQIKASIVGNQIDKSELLGYLAKIIVQLQEQKLQLDEEIYRLGRVAEDLTEDTKEERKTWRAERDQLQENLQSLHSKIEKITETYQGERIVWQTEREQLQENLGLINFKLEELTRLTNEERKGWKTERDLVQETITSLTTELMEARSEVVNYALSTSWKITRPFRWISKRLRSNNA